MVGKEGKRFGFQMQDMILTNNRDLQVGDTKAEGFRGGDRKSEGAFIKWHSKKRGDGKGGKTGGGVGRTWQLTKPKPFA